MKFMADKAELSSGIKNVIRAVPSKSMMSILECILITADSNGLTLVGNDLELGIETHVNAFVEEPGNMAVEAKMLNDIINKVSDTDVYFSTDSVFNTTIKCGKAKFKIAARDGAEFSPLPRVNGENTLTIPQNIFKTAIQETIFAVATADTNKMMTGECLTIKGGEAKITALDGHRIAIKKIEVDGCTNELEAIIPGKTMQNISKILKNSNDSMVNIGFTRDHVIFEFDGIRVVSRLIDGNYFDTDRLISNTYSAKVAVNKIDLIECLERATILVKETEKRPIIMKFCTNEIDIFMQTQAGTVNEVINAELDGDEIEMGFNPRYLIDAIRNIEEETVSLYMTTPKSPCYIKNEDGTYCSVVLPVNYSK